MTPKTLGALADSANIPVSADGRAALVTGITFDSREVTPGNLFVAIPGTHVDGHEYVADAVQNGASAVVVGHRTDEALGVPTIVAENPRAVLAQLACSFFDDPGAELTIAGVTGTDGKSTTTTMLWSAWRTGGISCGSMTTIDHRVDDTIVDNDSRQTTLESPAIQQWLRNLSSHGATHAVLETSSHALALHRVDSVPYRIAVFTQITSEHLD